MPYRQEQSESQVPYYGFSLRDCWKFRVEVGMQLRGTRVLRAKARAKPPKQIE